MPTAQSSSNAAFRPITGHIAPDILGFYRDGQPDYKRIADVVKLTKEDLGKISKVSKSSVCFDDAIPAATAIQLREIANIANLVAEFFDGDIHKVALWFELPNPHLGNVSPRTMIRGDRYKRLLNFVLESRESADASKLKSPAWHSALLRETEQRYDAGQEQSADWASAKRKLRERHK